MQINEKKALKSYFKKILENETPQFLMMNPKLLENIANLKLTKDLK